MDSLIYNVAQLLKSPVGTSVAYDFSEGDVQLEDIRTAGPLNGHARMRRTNQGLLIDGWVDLTLALTCDRCLKEFERPVHVTFEEQFYPTVDVISGLPLAKFDAEEIFPINAHHEVDLTEAIRQNTLTKLPMVTLCREDCQGLCSQCGQDLNLGPCECAPEVVDSRMSVLEQLLREQKLS
ncbi:MAG TPA: DUF177 domain-containing protein [Ktedonobacteraceae bacterium]|nr:DUF177 domain-containing protein [Ktedonobacteraceae bacterium]